MLWLLGLMDLIIGFSFLFLKFGVDIKLFAIFLAFYVIIKSLIFIRAFASIVDLIGGILLILLASYGFAPSLGWIFAIWFIQKGFFSFFS